MPDCWVAVVQVEGVRSTVYGKNKQEAKRKLGSGSGRQREAAAWPNRTGSLGGLLAAGQGIKRVDRRIARAMKWPRRAVCRTVLNLREQVGSALPLQPRP